MALTSTIYRFQIELADIERSVYETIEARVACHPSEDAERLVVRVLARAMAHEEGLDFGRGLSHSEDPALQTLSPQGEILRWIDVGVPSAERLHRASKRAKQVQVFTHKVGAALRKEWSRREIHRANEIELVRLDPELIRCLGETLERNTAWYVTVNDGSVGVTVGDASYDGPVERMSLAEFLAQGSP